MVRFLLSLLVILLLVSSKAYAINMGNVVSKDYADVSIGDSVKFKMLFWNADEENYTLRLSALDYPEDWTVIIDPDEFVLSKNIGEEYIRLPYMEESIRAKVVNLFVKPSERSLTGNYSVTIQSQAVSDYEGIMSMIPRSIISFKINVSGIEANGTKDNNLIGNGNTVVSDNNKNEDGSKSSFYLALLIIILVFSIALYKKYQ